MDLPFRKEIVSVYRGLGAIVEHPVCHALFRVPLRRRAVLVVEQISLRIVLFVNPLRIRINIDCHRLWHLDPVGVGLLPFVLLIFHLFHRQHFLQGWFGKRILTFWNFFPNVRGDFLGPATNFLYSVQPDCPRFSETEVPLATRAAFLDRFL